MINDSKIATKIKARISRFSEKISRGYKKPTRRFIKQMLYGIQASQDIKLSNIGRVLNEDMKPIRTEKRLSRNLAEEDLVDDINSRLIDDASLRIKENTVIALDTGDIAKEYARKMQNLASIRDGSTGKTAKGYWLMGVVAADTDGDELIPLYSEAYSQRAEDFESENKQIMKAVEAVIKKIEKRGIWVIDRGGDRKKLFEYFLGRDCRFVIRMNESRDIIILPSNDKKLIAQVVKELHCPYARDVQINREGKKITKRIHLGSIKVKLTFSEQELYLVVIKGFTEDSIILLTSLNVDETPEGLQRILEIYLTRWKCEESYRFIKDTYNLEDLRVLKYKSIRNLVVLLHAVFYFVSVELGRSLKLSILIKKIYEKAKRFFEIPEFNQYAIADGIYKLLFSSRTGIDTRKNVFKSNQLSFAFIDEIT